MLFKIYPNLTGTQKTPSTENLFLNVRGFCLFVCRIYDYMGASNLKPKAREVPLADLL